MIYLDNNATSPIDATVADCIRDGWSRFSANPSSQHQSGRLARRALEQAANSILKQCGASLRGMNADTLVWTSGGTEANNLAILGLTANRPGAIVVSGIEHASVLQVSEYLAATGRKIRILPTRPDGTIDVEILQAWLATHQASPPEDAANRIALVSMMLVNNETGIIQPVAEISPLCRQAGVLLHSDAVQAIGKLDVQFQSLQLDAMTMVAHKIHGPVGIGALVLRNGLALQQQLWGGFQQGSLRPGTEPVGLALGFAKAVELANQSRSENAQRMQSLRDLFEAKLAEHCSALGLPVPIVIGATSPRAPHTSCIAFPPADRQSLQMALDLAGIACSTGSACASGSSQPSHVLQAMGLAEPIVNSALRFSLSRFTTHEEIVAASRIVAETLQRSF